MAGCGCGGNQLEHYEQPPTLICIHDLGFNLNAVTPEFPLKWCHLLQKLPWPLCTHTHTHIYVQKHDFHKVQGCSRALKFTRWL